MPKVSTAGGGRQGGYGFVSANTPVFIFWNGEAWKATDSSYWGTGYALWDNTDLQTAMNFSWKGTRTLPGIAYPASFAAALAEAESFPACVLGGPELIIDIPDDSGSPVFTFAELNTVDWHLEGGGVNEATLTYDFVLLKDLTPVEQYFNLPCCSVDWQPSNQTIQNYDPDSDYDILVTVNASHGINATDQNPVYFDLQCQEPDIDFDTICDRCDVQPNNNKVGKNIYLEGSFVNNTTQQELIAGISFFDPSQTIRAENDVFTDPSVIWIDSSGQSVSPSCFNCQYQTSSDHPVIGSALECQQEPGSCTPYDCQYLVGDQLITLAGTGSAGEPPDQGNQYDPGSDGQQPNGSEIDNELLKIIAKNTGNTADNVKKLNNMVDRELNEANSHLGQIKTNTSNINNNLAITNSTLNQIKSNTANLNSKLTDINTGINKLDSDLVTGFDDLGAGLDGLRTDMNTGFSTLDTSINDGIETLDTDLQNLNDTLKGSDKTIDAPTMPDEYAPASTGDFQARFSEFVSDLQSSPIFSIPSKILTDIPTSDNSTISFNGGLYGLHTFDFADFGPVFITLRAILLTIFAFLSVRIIVLKR